MSGRVSPWVVSGVVLIGLGWSPISAAAEWSPTRAAKKAPVSAEANDDAPPAPRPSASATRAGRRTSYAQSRSRATAAPMGPSGPRATASRIPTQRPAAMGSPTMGSTPFGGRGQFGPTARGSRNMLSSWMSGGPQGDPNYGWPQEYMDDGGMGGPMSGPMGGNFAGPMGGAFSSGVPYMAQRGMRGPTMDGGMMDGGMMDSASFDGGMMEAAPNSRGPRQRYYPGYGEPTPARGPEYTAMNPGDGAAVNDGMPEEIPPGGAMDGGFGGEGEFVEEGSDWQGPIHPYATQYNHNEFHPVEPWVDSGMPNCDPYGSFGPCSSCGFDSCGGWCGYPWWCRPWFPGWCWWESASLIGGVHAFKGPVDQGRHGNFGFHEGFNIGGPLLYDFGLGWQAGGSAYQSNFSGDNVVNNTNDVRNQYFFTAGLFRRVRCLGPRGGGFQYGVVGDYLSENYYVNQQFGQVRAEFSLISPFNHEIGFWGAFSGNESVATFQTSPTAPRVQERWQPQNLYAFFYRRCLPNCGQGRLWGGFTGDGDGLFGGDFRMPLMSWLALESNFQYLIPRTEPQVQNFTQEAWNLSINLVWYPGCTARCASKSRWRPLLPVADNSTLILERLNGSGVVVP